MHLGQSCPTIQRMTAVGVAEPVRRDVLRDASSLGRALQHVANRPLLEPRTTFSRGEDGIVGAGVPA